MIRVLYEKYLLNELMHLHVYGKYKNHIHAPKHVTYT